MRTVQRICKELDESKGDYEGTAARKTHTDRSDKKRILEFVGEGLKVNTEASTEEIVLIWVKRVAV